MQRNGRKIKWVGMAVGGLLGLGLVWLAVANAQANRRLEDRLAAVKAAGEPISLTELSRKPIPPEANAATFLNRAQDGMAAIDKVMAADFGADEKDFENGKAGGRAYLAAKSALQNNPEVTPLLMQASQAEQYDPQLNFSLGAQEFFQDELFPTFPQKRSAARILHYQTLVNLADGQSAAAFAHSLALLRLARLFESDPLIVNHLVVLAIRSVGVQSMNLVLRGGPLPDEAHDALEAELARTDPAKTYRHIMLSDRAYGVTEFADMVNKPLKVGRLPNDKNLECDYLDLMATLIADGPRTILSDEAQKILARSAALTEMVGPAVQAISEADARGIAHCRALRILNQIARVERDGVQPNVGQLALPKDVLTDPYNGQPLTITKLPEGWLIYAVGKNLKDDGGKVERHDDVGLAPLDPSKK